MVVKGGNASPEFAKVVPFGRYEEFAVNYKVQVTGKGEQVFLINEVFGIVEYDPAILSGDLVESFDFAPIMEVITKTQTLAERYPALRQEAPRFLKPLLEAVSYRDQGLVQFRGGWMKVERYREILEAQNARQKDSQELSLMVERAQKAELERREAEARAQIAVANNKIKAQARAQEDEEKRRLLDQKRAEEARMQDAEMLTRQKVAEEARHLELQSHIAAVARDPVGRMLKAEWETLLEGARDPRDEAWKLSGFQLPRAAQTLLTSQHFPKEAVAIPAWPGISSSATVAESEEGRSLLILLNDPEGSRSSTLMAFELPVDPQSRLMKGEAAERIALVLGDISRDMVRQLPRALSTCLTSLPRAGALSRRAPLSASGIDGYLAVTRPMLGADGAHHVIVLIALGFAPNSGSVGDSDPDPAP
ncbi:MAG TPA: hypothetical protein VK956_14350, partial [Verrucomicrobium sp.]|nr:hypothetical protein [Verrucomicrobium sp.]